MSSEVSVFEDAMEDMMEKQEDGSKRQNLTCIADRLIALYPSYFTLLEVMAHVPVCSCTHLSQSLNVPSRACRDMMGSGSYGLQIRSGTYPAFFNNDAGVLVGVSPASALPKIKSMVLANAERSVLTRTATAWCLYGPAVFSNCYVSGKELFTNNSCNHMQDTNESNVNNGLTNCGRVESCASMDHIPFQETIILVLPSRTNIMLVFFLGTSTFSL
ncbi:hypothetical protein V6N13_084256 [Hibiscus sabdariffa]